MNLIEADDIRNRFVIKPPSRATRSLKKSLAATTAIGNGNHPLFDLSNNDDDEDLISNDSYCTKNDGREHKCMYTRACRMVGVVPSKRFAKQMSNTHVNISENAYGPNDTKAIAIFLISNCTIESLDISGNDIGPSGACYLCDALRKNQNIRELNVANTNPTESGLFRIVHMLTENKSLRMINISGNGIGSKHIHLVVKILMENKYLEELYVANNQLDEEGALFLGPAIAANETLKILDLSWNHIRGKGTEAISAAIANNCRLEVLNLSWNGFDRPGCRTMSDALYVNTTLRELDLSDNRIDLKAIQLLLPGLIANNGLNKLMIGKNPMTTEGAIAIVRELKSATDCTLFELTIENVPVDEEFFEALRELQSSRSIFVQYGHFYRQHDIGIRQRRHSLSLFNPASILFECMKQRHLRLVDFFRILDADNSQSITKEEFKEGLTTMNIPLTDEALDLLLRQLDEDDDNKIDLLEFTAGKRKARRDELKKQMNTNDDDSHDIEMMKKLRAIVKQRLNERKL